MVVGTANKGGHDLTKSFRVYTNDRNHSRIQLTVTGKVTSYMDVSPERVNLSGRLGEEIAASVRIIPEKNYPFTIKEAKPRLGQNIRLDLKPLGKNASATGYLLIVTSTKSSPGSFGDYIEIKTDLKEKSSFGIPVRGRIYGEATKAN